MSETKQNELMRPRSFPSRLFRDCGKKESFQEGKKKKKKNKTRQRLKVSKCVAKKALEKQVKIKKKDYVRNRAEGGRRTIKLVK